jgi:NAD(P)-dependent dehydrogenase (short-subunit alcohol dehydrogenase family)
LTEHHNFIVAINYASNTARATAALSQLPEGCIAIKGDISKRGECLDLVKEAHEKLGGLDLVVANAGWSRPTPFNDIDAFTEEDWDTAYAFNVKQSLWLAQAAKPIFNANPNGGHLIITSSVAGTRASGSSVVSSTLTLLTQAYSVTKAAAIHTSKCLAKALAPKIRVNTISPSMIKTEWSARFGEDKIKAHVAGNALKKMTDIEDVGLTVAWMVECESLTAQNICVDAGIGL